jgi:hypothetical protein
MIFERRILRKFVGSFKKREGQRIRTNRELNKVTGGANVVRFIKAQRVKW